MGKITNLNVQSDPQETETLNSRNIEQVLLRVHRKIREVVLHNSFLKTVKISWGTLLLLQIHKMTSQLGHHNIHQHCTVWLYHAKGEEI